MTSKLQYCDSCPHLVNLGNEQRKYMINGLMAKSVEGTRKSDNDMDLDESARGRSNMLSCIAHYRQGTMTRGGSRGLHCYLYYHSAY